ncbi:ependymin-related protein 1-like [Ostrea edulis]|uniref:ependymin-related protein 1-like n=1 Tax=Ostrea edulis TaxID=37623 RepID=UPI0024AED0C1|nr:ependymin-related protein 1-like [Ostrea edulis]
MKTAEMDKLYCVSLLVYLAVVTPPCFSQICCTPDVWIADMFLDYGIVFIDSNKGVPSTAYSYINGTIKATYDYPNQRSYLKLQGAEVSPLIPGPGVPYDTTIISDYKNGIQYTIGADGSCQKDKVDNMTKQCIPEDAELVSTGSLAMEWNKVENYKFAINDDSTSVDATVSRNLPSSSCNPVHVVYFVGSAERGSGTMINLDVLNVVPYNIDPSVFDVPPQCRNARFKMESDDNKGLQRILRMGIFI